MHDRICDSAPHRRHNENCEQIEGLKAGSKMIIVESVSPNEGPRPGGVVPDLIVLHGTAGKSDRADVAWCTNSTAKVSYHYIVGRDGRIYSLVSEDRRAWHAGLSAWKGRANCNDFSIGIGLSNAGNGELYTDGQYKVLGELVADIRARRSIPWKRVVGHYHISPGRKTDPWYTFEWMRIVSHDED